MREFLSRFRFDDFAAYFLPGLAMLCAFMWALTLTVFDVAIRRAFAGISIFEGIMFVCAAYITGAFLSGSSHKIFPYIFRLTRRQRFIDARTLIQPPEFRHTVLTSFNALFGTEVSADAWEACHFYLARSLVNEKMPHASADAIRQNDLMRLRENMVIPLITLWAVTLAFSVDKARSDLQTGIIVAATATLIAYVAAGRLVGRAADNRKREVRDVCTALIVVHRLEAIQRSAAAAEPRKNEPSVIMPSHDVLPIRASTSDHR